MKRKYHGVVAVTFSLVTLMTVGGYAGAGLWRSTDVGRPPFLPPALNIKVPSDAQVHQVEALEARMDKLATPSVRPVTAKALTLFGYQDPSRPDKGTIDGGAGHAGPDSWQLSLTVQTGINNYCVINGKFVAEGAVMDDGARVLKIENYRVLILADQEQRWLYLEDDLSSSVDGSEHVISDQGKGQS